MSHKLGPEDFWDPLCHREPVRPRFDRRSIGPYSFSFCFRSPKLAAQLEGLCCSWHVLVEVPLPYLPAPFIIVFPAYIAFGGGHCGSRGPTLGCIKTIQTVCILEEVAAASLFEQGGWDNSVLVADVNRSLRSSKPQGPGCWPRGLPRMSPGLQWGCLAASLPSSKWCLCTNDARADEAVPRNAWL